MCILVFMFFFFFFNDTATTEIYTLSLHDALPIFLARLLLDANRTVSVQRLVDDLWGEDMPESAPKMVQIYVSHLRKLLPGGVLLTQAPGYRVEVEPEALDLTRFGRLREEGREALEAGDATAAA